MIASQISQIKERGLRPVIISTPDSFWKVYDILGEQIFHDYKCIIDEIHCFQEAASYRDMLPEFLDNYFVRFERKAIITATLMPLSHPCFAKWQTVRIVPEYEYRQPLNIYYSMNQLYASVTDFITSLPEKENKIVFFTLLRYNRKGFIKPDKSRRPPHYRRCRELELEEKKNVSISNRNASESKSRSLRSRTVQHQQP